MPYLILLLLLAACSTPEPEPEASAEPWTLLVSSPYALDPAAETTQHDTIVLDRDVTIGGLRPVAPPGTHHLVLSVAGVTGNDQLFVSQLGTEELHFPPGVGFVLPKGTALRLDGHFVNPGDGAVSGRAGIEVLELAPGAPVVVADQIYPSVTQGTVPPGPATLAGTCTVTSPGHVFALLPHMHWYGRHMRLVARRAAGDVVLFDGDVDPEHSSYALLAGPVALAAGDRIDIECRYHNTGSEAVPIGGESDEEMCIAMVYRYPASPALDSWCTN
jgi:hypothetical protein